MRVHSPWRLPAMLAALAAAACHDTALGPSARPRVTLTLQVLPPNIFDGIPSGPYIKVEGDSVVAWTAASISGCSDYTATGEAPEGLLLLRFVETETPRVCIPEGTTMGATVVAHDLPKGSRTVGFLQRFVKLDGSSHESALARTRVDVP